MSFHWCLTQGKFILTTVFFPCVCVCVCVCERERERETDRQRQRQRCKRDRNTQRDREIVCVLGRELSHQPPLPLTLNKETDFEVLILIPFSYNILWSSSQENLKQRITSSQVYSTGRAYGELQTHKEKETFQPCLPGDQTAVSRGSGFGAGL